MSTIRNPNREAQKSMPQRYVPEWRRRGTGRESVQMDETGRIIDSKFERPGSATNHGGTALNVGTGPALDHSFLDGQPVDDEDVEISEEYEVPPQQFKFPRPQTKQRTIVMPRQSQPDSTDESLSQSGIAPGEYVVMFEGDVIDIGPLEMVRRNLTRILLGQDPRFGDANLSPNNFIVLKRVELDFGLIIKD